MKTIALYSIEGGVGKSTLAVNLAYRSAMNQIRSSDYCNLDVLPSHKGLRNLAMGRLYQELHAKGVM